MEASRVADAPNQEIKLADYQPPAFYITNIDLIFKVFDGYVDVYAKSRINRSRDHSEPLKLDGGPYMQLLSLSINNVGLDQSAYTLNDDSMIIDNVPDQFELEVVTRLSPDENTRLEGLYASGGNLCTQCEAEGFRHITYYIDRPDVLAVYSVRIEADQQKYPVLLSNGDNTAAGLMENGRHYSCWNDPYPKPSYLFALVAGQLSAYSDEYVTTSGRNVALNIYVRTVDLDKCDYAMQSLKRAMKWDEDVYGFEYDLGIYNIVAVSDFNMGAMENKGLNLFNTKYVLANEQTATDVAFDNIEAVIGHEYFHNWTGNRVTCRDWFQLSLKEGLTVFRDQEFSSDMTSRAVKRIADVRMLRMIQFPEDAGPLAHPVRPESYVEINNFYTATVYNKGAEVIRMMQTVLGKSAFNKAVRSYVAAFDGQAATCADFVDVMELVGKKDLSQFRLWYSQAGTPTVTVARETSGTTVRLIVEQRCKPTPGQHEKKPFHIPLVIGWIDEAGAEIYPDVQGNAAWNEDGCLLELNECEQVFEFSNVPSGAVPSLHRGFSAPVHLISDLSDDEYGFLVGNDQDAYARWQAAQELYASYILSACEDRKTGGGERYQRIASAFLSILRQEGLDFALMAELLTLPTEVYLGQLQDVLKPEALFKAREALIAKLGQDAIIEIKRRLNAIEDKRHGQTQEAKAVRKLRSVLLGYLVAVQSDYQEAVKNIIIDQYYKAENMTEQLAALSLVSHSTYSERQSILQHFYERWQHDDLVIDKWFAVQAQSKRNDTLDNVQMLMKHKAFSYKNPNRLRSLVGIFTMLNQAGFHAENGNGYEMLRIVVENVDTINPQTAARMVAPLCRWARMDENRQQLMKNNLQLLLSKKGLSTDVHELVAKSLP